MKRRFERLDLRNFSVNTNIAGRAYQLEAIKRVGEALVITKDNIPKGEIEKRY